MSPVVLVPLYLAVCLAPLLLAALGARTPRGALDELATAAGMLAFAVILVEFVLSGRFRTVSRRIGMDVTMRVHQLMARTALVLALIHPFLYRAPMGPALPWDPDRQLTLTHDLATLGSGIAAWVLLPAFVLISIFRDTPGWRYETWRAIHGLGAAAIAALLLHHTLTAGRYAADPALAWTWIALSAAAFGTLAWVYVLAPLGRWRRPWRLAAVRPTGPRVWELTLAPEGHAGLDYRAGQFVWLNLGHGPFSLCEHPFSIASAPSEGADLRFLVKELGDFTDTVGRLAPGTRAYVDGPYGNLVVEGREAVGIGLVAGGVGLAPLLAILRERALARDPRPRLLVYGEHRLENVACAEELDRLARARGTEIVTVLAEPPPGWNGRTGLIDPSLLRTLFRPEMRRWLWVLCGPNAMMARAEDTLIALGVPACNVLSERFRYD